MESEAAEKTHGSGMTLVLTVMVYISITLALLSIVVVILLGIDIRSETIQMQVNSQMIQYISRQNGSTKGLQGK